MITNFIDINYIEKINNSFVIYELSYNCIYLNTKKNLNKIEQYLKSLSIDYTIIYDIHDIIIDFNNISIYSYNYDSQLLKFYYIV